MGAAKNIMFADRTEKSFNYLKVIRTTYPNNASMYELRPVKESDDPRGTISITTQPGQLLRETSCFHWRGSRSLPIDA
jgi:hypothetical protein